MTAPDSHISEKELEEFVREFEADLEKDGGELLKFERTMRRVIVFFVLGCCLLILVSILGCADNGHEKAEIEPPCRMDQAGPPAPGETRPLCKGYI